ncbi:elongation factor EF1-gamma (glutathione S-transferase family) [Cryptosporidium xiaoi]|uniref:Elongation factor EF1-gamma (Glutathione S-transferase family) n=1 Tax=Cryptosporidium xiaoi TaxID=659607 RepID=A0AAV9XZM9_9CRYT
METMILYSFDKCPMASVIMSVAEITGNKITLKSADNLELKTINLPLKKGTPVLVTKLGEIFGTSTIIRHLARGSPYTNLYGRSPSDATHVDMMLYYLDSEMAPLIRSLCPVSGCSGDKTSTYKELMNIFTKINEYLTRRTFIVGHRLTIADIFLAVMVDSVVLFSNKSISLDTLVNLRRYLDTVLNQPAVKKHYGELSKKCCQGQTKTQSQSQSGGASEDKAKKKENPLDSLPPSSMSLDEWKRVYSNTKDLRGVAMPWLEKNFDPNGYCFYYMKYNKLPDELDVAFRASNMVGGFLQRLDNNFRKYSFGVINIVGGNGEFDYQGVFLFRGNEIPEEMVSHPSFEYHTFKRLDFSNNAERSLISDYFCNDEEVEGLKIQDCKVWK